MFGIKSKIKLLFLKLRWRKLHPDTIPMRYFDPSLVQIGKHSYGELNITSFNNKSKLSIGSFSSVAQNVHFLLDVEHYTNHISSYPFRVKILKEKAEAFSNGDIVLEDDVWIGYGATILSGVKIGQGAVVGAGSLVVHDIEPYAIAVGVPARIVKYRFSQDIIDFLLTLDYSKLTEEMIREHINDLYKPIESLALEEMQEIYSWFPKKRADMAASATASAASSTVTTPGADASADSAPSELTTTQQHYQCDQYDRNSHMSENTTENNAEENSEVELLMMDQKSINSIIAVIQDSDLPLIKTCFNTVTVTTKSDGTEGHELRILIADYVSFNPCTPLANAWVADNILLFTVFDGVLENRYGLQEGASFRNHYDNIPEVTDLDKMSKFCYRVMKLIRNAIQHNLSAVHYTPPSGQNTASFGPYSINYIHRGTTFSLDIDNKAVQFLYTIVVNLVTNSINKMQLTQGHYEGILNAMFEQMKEGISSLSDDISVWSNTNTASTTTPTTVATSPASSTNVNNATSSPSQQSQQNQQSSQQTSTARYDSQHLRFYQRYVVENPVIIQDDVESAIAGSSGNSSFVIFKHIEENPTIDETSNQYWYSTDYRYKDYLLPQELGSITWGTGSDVISCREQAIIRFNKADITDRWKLR